ncbi:MAG: glycosyltransferase family 4 protein, partial [Acetobacteraceae bacterium]
MRLLIDLQAAQAGNRERGIGRYALALTEALLRQAASHEVWIALNDAFPETIEPLRALFDRLLPQQRIVVWRTPMPAAGNNPANDWRRSAGEILRESFIAGLEPDIVYLPSLFEGLVDDAVTSVGQITDGTRAAVAIHDLIPLMRPDLYLADPAVANGYQRKITSLRRAGLWLPVSDWSRREAMARLDLPGEKAVVVANAADARFRPMVLTEEERGRILARFGLSRPFVLYTGGADARKNIEGLLAAWARLPEPTRAQQQLAIVGAFDRDSLAAIHRRAERSGLGPDELVLTGFVADDDLVFLYNLCRVFCFPSLFEGFGLPVLEAMQCGAPTIGANRTGIPEVIGRVDALFDPLDPAAIAAR